MGGGVVGYRVAVEDDMRRASHDGGGGEGKGKIRDPRMGQEGSDFPRD